MKCNMQPHLTFLSVCLYRILIAYLACPLPRACRVFGHFNVAAVYAATSNNSVCLYRILITYLSAYYSGITGTPGIIHGNLLEPELISSGIIAPFASRRPDGAAAFGVPTRISPEIRCDNRSELLRMAVAALVRGGARGEKEGGGVEGL